MKISSKILILSLFLSTALGIAAPALAYSPILSASYQGGSSNEVQVNISDANPYSEINLYTQQSSSLWTVVNNVGQTDGNGNFTQVISLAPDGSSNAVQIYVTVGGQQSPTVSVYPNNGNYGCSEYNNCNSGSGGLSLSQTSLNLNIGQSINVSAIYSVNGYNNNIFVSSNSNPSVASASAVASQVAVYGLTSGNDTIVVCASNSVSACASLYVTVGNGSNNCSYYNNCGGGTLSLSQTNISLIAGQTSYVSVYNNLGGTLYVSSNSSPGVVSATVSGSSLTLYGLTSGSSTISVCSNNGYSCASLYVTVTGTSGGNGSVYFSPATPGLYVGQSLAVSINSTAYNSYAYNGSNTYYISSNSSPNVVSASISGTVLNLYAEQTGSSSISVCSTSLGFCGTLYVTVAGNGSGSSCGAYNNCSGTLSLSQTSVNLNLGQSVAVSAYNNNGNALYVSSNSNSQVATYTISGSNVDIYASEVGSTTLNICSNSGYACASLYVTVNNNGSCGYYGCGTGTLSLSQTSLTLNVGQNSTINIYGSGSYYISSNSNPSAVGATISGTTVDLYGSESGNDDISICQNGGQCATVYVTVSGSGIYNSGGLSLSQTSLNLSAGQTATVNIYGGAGYGYYVSSNSNPAVAIASQNGSALSIYGSQNGSSTLQVCANNISNCATLYVTVGGYSYNNGGGTGSLQYPGGTGSVLGTSTYANGELINQNSTVYIVYQNTITGFSSASVFSGLGFSFSNVVNVGNSGLASSGYTVSSAYASHPWGTWIKDGGSTVYFVSQNGLIPVPDWNTFLNNGGQASWIVRANTADFQLPILSPMTNGDPRLQ